MVLVAFQLSKKKRLDLVCSIKAMKVIKKPHQDTIGELYMPAHATFCPIISISFVVKTAFLIQDEMAKNMSSARNKPHLATNPF